MVTGSAGFYIFMYVIPGIFTLIGLFLSSRLKSKFMHYSQVPMSISGAEAAARMLRDNNIQDVQIVEGQGFLTDHYNPMTKTVSLSPDVFHGKNVSALAVAAHEVGHAVQHAEAYSWLQLRSAIVPVVQFSSMAQQWVLMAAFYMTNVPQIMLVAIGVFAVTAFFSFVTLPVEFDATRRGLQWLDMSGVAKGEQYDGAKDALWWAAMTYVSAALSALVMLLFLIMRFLGNRE